MKEKGRSEVGAKEMNKVVARQRSKSWHSGDHLSERAAAAVEQSLGEGEDKSSVKREIGQSRESISASEGTGLREKERFRAAAVHTSDARNR